VSLEFIPGIILLGAVKAVGMPRRFETMLVECFPAAEMAIAVRAVGVSGGVFAMLVKCLPAAEPAIAEITESIVGHGSSDRYAE
jgi:hypothetical protein